MLAMKQSPVQESYRQNQVQPTSYPSTYARPRQQSVLWHRISTLGCITACCAIFWFVANTGAKIDNLNYKIDQLQTSVHTASADNASLSLKVDQLQQPDRILGIAMGQLHMQWASPVHIQATAPQTKH
jgi:cell division protein FtsL